MAANLSGLSQQNGGPAVKRPCPGRPRSQSFAREWPTVLPDSKIVNDPIHGHIEIPYLCIQIMDTPQFQRLRNLKQLGTTYLVFPGASHNRFEHSVGVCYLAGELVRNLQIRQPELDISDQDVLCVQIAGLCHDLGHGPFSHLFEHSFIHVLDPESTWRHERASIMMFDHLLETNNLLPVFIKFGLTDRDVTFIKEMIYGELPAEGQAVGAAFRACPCPSASSSDESLPWRMRGRSEDKRYLYEIVANKRNGIDVDKFDYFSRDCYHLNIKNNFDHVRWIKFARVVEVEGQLQLCTRDKEVSNLYDLFSTRHSLHRRAYQHKVVKLIDHMVGEVLVKANDGLLIEGPDGKRHRMSDAIWDMKVYSRITDTVFERILWSIEPELKEARDLAMQIQTRKLYRCIGQMTVEPEMMVGSNFSVYAEELAREANVIASDSNFRADEFVIQTIVLDYGKKSKNPIDFVRFYSKAEQDVAKKVKKSHVSRMLPENFSERSIRVFLRRRDEQSGEVARKAFVVWAEGRGFSTPIASGDTLGVDMSQSLNEGAS